MNKLYAVFFITLLLQLQVNAQNHIIKGTVKDVITNEPIYGVSVGVKGTTVGASTNFDGEFLINVSDTVKKLVFQLIGYKRKEVAISNNMVVSLQSSALELEGTVITANAIQREKRSLGYSTQEVGAEDLTAGQNVSAISALQGKVSGANITTTTGAPGSSVRVVLRGGTSLTGNNQALMVVDGVPIDNSNFSNGDDLNNQVDYGNRGNDINPEDIESISVLKGPAAAALYGSRASNGALIITTKHGHKNSGGNTKTDITFTSNMTFSNILKMPTFQNQYGQGDVYPGRDPVDRRENFSWGLPFNGQERPWGQDINGQQQVKPYADLPNNVRDFFNTGTTLNNNLSLSGGNDKSTYYLSLNSQNNKGIVPGTSFDKYGVRFSGTTEMSNHFSSSVSMNYTDISSNLGSGGQGPGSIYSNLYQTARDIPIPSLQNFVNPFNWYNDANGKYGFYGAYTVNPYFVLQNFQNLDAVDRLQGNFSVSYNNFGWLTLTERMGSDVYSDRRTEEWKKYSYTPYDTYYTGNNQIYQGKYSSDIFNLNEYTHDFIATAKKDLTKDLKLMFLVGNNIRQSNLTETFGQTNAQGGLAVPDFYNLANSNGPALTANTLTQRRLVGVYSDADLAYKNMLFLGATARNDWSSTLPLANNSFFYPSVNASWVFTELIKDTARLRKIISFGKLRTSYASVGNDAAPYLTSTVFSQTNISGGFGNTQFPFNGITGYGLSGVLGNNTIKPELTTAVEGGAEFGFLKDRIGFDFTLYQSTSVNQIISVPMANSSGFTNQTINTGEIQNKGIEVLLRGTPVMTSSGFKLDVYGTFTKNNNMVVSIANGIDQVTIGGFSSMAVVAAVGKPYGTFYGVDLLKDKNGHTVIDSASGLPRTTPNSQYFGSYNPDWMASLGVKMSYKGFTLNILFDTKQGGVFYSNTKSLTDFNGTAAETVVNGSRADFVWTNSVYEDYKGNYVTNNNVKTNVENYFTNTIQSAPGQNIVDATYIKLRELSLMYALPSKRLAKTSFGSVSLGVFANNLFIWTPKSNAYTDPEMNSSGASNTQGFEFSAQPSQRNYGFNIRATF